MTENATQPENAKKTSWFSYVKSSFKPKNYVSYAVLALLIAFFLVFGKGFKQTNVLMLEKISYSVIAALSLSLVVGFLGELSLGQAGFMCLGAYLGGYFQTYVYGAFSQSLPLLSLLITMLLGGFFAAIAGLIIGLPALRLKGDYLAIVTLAFGEIVKVVFRNLKTFGAEKGMETIRYSPSSLYIIGFFAVLFTLVVIRNFIKSKHGRAVTAIRDNEIAARAMGVNVTYYKLVVFVLSAFFAGVAGVLFSNANYTIKSISFDYNYSIDILVMVVLGGMGSLNGTMLSAALITFLNAKLSTVLTGDLAALQKLVYALVLVLIVIYNNAPKLKTFREKYNLRRLREKLSAALHRLFLKKHPSDDPAAEKPDAADWSNIPTKVPMDAILSTDFTPGAASDEDKPDKPERNETNKNAEGKS